MLTFLDWVAHNAAGPPRNVEVSHQIDRKYGIWQFTKGRIRVLWFYDEGRWLIVSHGFLKETKATPPAEIAKARTAVIAYFDAKKTANLQFLED